MQTRLVFKCWGLLLLLLTAQQGSIDHELSHLSHAAGSVVHARSSGLEEANCALCPAFAQVATAALGYSFAPPLRARATLDVLVARAPVVIDAATPRPRNRGPPSLS